MCKSREVLRLKLESGRSLPQIAASCQLGLDTVSDHLARARASSLSWQDVQALSDAEFGTRPFRQRQYARAAACAPSTANGAVRRSSLVSAVNSASTIIADAAVSTR
jgi:hypothetical protein